ncbi:MAG: hypothetical protein Q7K45_07270 [Nanoarchaeota archaeon]|nr:hypothetical protein [Nanoarchaeota archaeon]
MMDYINKIVLDRRKEIPFIIFGTFLITFLIARILGNAVHPQGGEAQFLDFVKPVVINGNYIHHFTWGIILLAVAGFWSLTDAVKLHVRLVSILYGVGLALVMDEFGVLVTLDKNAYWNRGSYDAIIVTTFLLLCALYFSQFWGIMGKFFRAVFKR